MTMPSAGWYADPDNASTHRWWNGIAWTDSRTPAPAPAPVPVPVPVTPVEPVDPPTTSGYQTNYQSGHQPSYPANYGSSYQPISPPVYQKLTAPAGTAWSTPWIWLLVVLPHLSGIAAYLFILIPDAFGDTGLQYYETGSFAAFIPYILGLIAYAIGVGCALLDYRELKNRGVPRPFHWAWAFANTWGVYTIGRSIVVKSRTGRGLAPLWVTVGIFGGGIVLTLVAFVFMLSAVFGLY